MNKRPLCVVLGTVIFLILVFRGTLEKDDGENYQGEQKTIQCQAEEISGQGEFISLVVCDVMEEGVPLCSRIKLYAESGEGILKDIKIGNILSVTGKIYSFSHPGNPGQFDEYRYYHDQGISYRFFAQSVTIENDACEKTEQWLCDIRTSLYNSIMTCLPSDEAGVVAAMVLGEKCALSEEIQTLYQENGIAHILAISGLHLSFIGSGLFFLLRRYVMPMRPAALTTGVLLLLYGELTGFSISAQRAVWMMLCFLAARFLGRRYDLYCALALSALIQLLVHPTVLFQAGFLLSYGTVFGIAVFVQDFQQTDRDQPGIWQVFLGSLGIQIVTMPVILYYYFEINPYSVLLNVVVLPLVSVLLFMSVAGSLAVAFSLAAGRFLYGTVHYILLFYHYLGNIILELPVASYIVGRPAIWQMLLYYLLLGIWILLSHYRTEDAPVRGGILVAAVFLLVFQIPVKGQLQITNLDVGQGDCVCIRLADKTILIDGGSSDVKKIGKYRISRYLKYYGIQRLDYVFITHSDHDHTSGIIELVQAHNNMGFDIGSVVLPGIGKTDENYQELEQLCQDNGVTVNKMKKGDQIQIGQLYIRCLHPFQEYDWHTENDYSLVLKLQYGNFDGLFVGDLEKEGEQEIIGQIADVDYLKVGHHGSAGSSGEDFLAALKPEIAVISAGEGNRYGHPAPAALERLRNMGADIYSTIERGAVTTVTDGEKITVSTYK